MDNNPDAAPAQTPEMQASEAPNTNINQGEVNETNGNDTKVNTPQVSQRAEIPADQVEAWNKFMEANGGFSKVFQKVKETISNPQPKVEAPTQGMVAEQPTEIQTAPIEAAPQKPAQGYLSVADIAKLNYSRMLSEAYPELDKDGYVAKGEFVKEAVSMGIPVVDQAGNVNDDALRKFLDLKKAALPPAPASAPVTATPTVEYATIEGELDSQTKADKIMAQGEGHPLYKQAVEFTRNSLFPKQNKGVKK